MKETGRSNGRRESDAARNALPPRESQADREELLRQYELVNKSLEELGMVVAALLLNYYTVNVQKEQLSAAISGSEIPFTELDLFPFQLSAAVMILSASSFFFGVSEDAQEQPQSDPVIQESMQLNSMINALVLIAAVVRIYNLMLVRFSPQSESESTQATEVEETLEDSLV